MVFEFIEILFKILLFKGGVLIYAEHCRYVLPKRQMVRLNIPDSSGKVGGNSPKNCSSLSAFPPHLPELGFEFRIALQFNELHLKYRRSILHVEGEGVSNNLKSVSVCLEVRKPAIKCGPTSMSALHAGKWQSFV